MPRCRPANAWHSMRSKSSSRRSSALATAAANAHDLSSLPAWAARRRGGRPALGAGRLQDGTLHVRRVKNGAPASHPLTGREMREVRQHQRESPQSPFIFVSQRGSPLAAPGFSPLVERAGVVADLGIKVHAHMLRRSSSWSSNRHAVGSAAIHRPARCRMARNCSYFSGWHDRR